ncbi:LacI family transcriptional regulator [Alicyclobacillus cellulosilyticus]|uniref:LacI family transcriptional regulator n=1 Tax=Alicyclobacillus cellulosilyticus TaxID=1003997 RepID=A0A917K271_9BACL|nr:LacI family DNA-binding transcriptional regulator [Alicyclobacillus cellulosilyticus]GGI98322.1 LacI family transcriptional regulator [Alicyclobacillus cellulosilyticus]
MATIYDIAKRAGVSPATVSRVLNSYPDVSPKTRAKVQRVIQDLDYQPSSLARGLATKRSMTIGAFVKEGPNDGLRHPLLSDVLATFQDVAGEKGYDILFFSLNEANPQPDKYEAIARYRHVDGLLVLGLPRTDPAVIALSTCGIPCISIDLDLIGPRAGYVMSDNVGGAMQAVEFLVRHGHRAIAFIGDQFATKPGHDRLIGFQRAIQAFHLPFRPEWVQEGDFTDASGYQAMQRLFELPDIPTAVFCASDLMAIGAMRAIQERGLNVGADISVIGFDDIRWASMVTPALTTIRQRKDELGRQAAYALLRMMEEPSALPPVITVPTELVVRDTVGVCQVKSWPG